MRHEYICQSCGFIFDQSGASFCISCGARLQSNVKQASYLQPPTQTESAKFSRALIDITRLLAAACMISGIIAIMQFATTTSTGRLLVGASIGVSILGQLFIWQATKPSPKAWTGSVLALFWMGLVILGVLWGVIVYA